MSTLPIGWENRNNQMSEKDLKLGGDAANKFSSKKMLMNAYDDGSSGYKSSEEVKAFYMQQIEQQEQQKQQEKQEQQQQQDGATNPSSSLPLGWEDRQRNRQLQAKQFGVFSNSGAATMPPASGTAHLGSAVIGTNTSPTSLSSKTPTTSATTAEAALVKVATTALDAMAQSLENNPVALSPEERAAFATAMQRAMNAIAKCR